MRLACVGAERTRRDHHRADNEDDDDADKRLGHGPAGESGVRGCGWEPRDYRDHCSEERERADATSRTRPTGGVIHGFVLLFCNSSAQSSSFHSLCRDVRVANLQLRRYISILLY